MFQRFTEPARKTVTAAQGEARRLRHSWIGTEHLLLALAADRESLGGRLLEAQGVRAEELRDAVRALVGEGGKDDETALATIGIDLGAVRRAVEAVFGEGALERTRTGCVPFTRRAKKALELALREALALQHDFIGTEHLLLGLAHGEGLAHELLEARGLDYERLRALVVDALAA